jgi:Histidine kinase-like ATPase domain
MAAVAARCGYGDKTQLICEVCDRGQVVDPLVGRHRPVDGQLGGRGLWVVNQLCDLVQVRSSPSGTTVRVHISSNDSSLTVASIRWCK